MRAAWATVIAFWPVLALPCAAQPKWVRERIALEKACGDGEAAACTEAGKRIEHGDTGPYGTREPNPTAAAPFYERACTAGERRGCAAFARLCETGVGRPKDVDQARKLYATACNQGDASGCLGAGRLAAEGASGESSRADPGPANGLYKRAFDLLTASCDRGHGEDCARLGGFFDEGRFGLPKDGARALAAYERACLHEVRWACSHAARRLSQQSPAADPSRAQQLTDRAKALAREQCDRGDLDACAAMASNLGRYKGCEHGDPGACFQLGMSYIAYRDDEPRDAEKAAHFLLKGCNHGAPELCVEAGDLYMGVYARARREITPRDAPKAAAFYGRACDAGDSEGCQKLASLAAAGRGLTPDPSRAARLYEGECERGQTRACVELGTLLRRGHGVPRDPSRAAQLYERACLSRNTAGCFELGALRRDGDGVPRDEAAARDLFRDVCATNPYYDAGSSLVGCREACALDVGSACAALARAAERGSAAEDLHPQATADFYRRAAKMFDKECTAGAAQSCYDLARLHREERPLGRDQQLYGRLLERSCALDLAVGCHDLAQAHSWGSPPFPSDHKRAAELYLEACGLEDIQSCEQAASMVAAGDGLPANEGRSQELLERARSLRRKRGF